MTAKPCPDCKGDGVVAHVRAYDSGEDATEERCDTCGGNGCGDCMPVDDPRVER